MSFSYCASHWALQVIFQLDTKKELHYSWNVAFSLEDEHSSTTVQNKKNEGVKLEFSFKVWKYSTRSFFENSKKLGLVTFGFLKEFVFFVRKQKFNKKTRKFSFWRIQTWVKNKVSKLLKKNFHRKQTKNTKGFWKENTILKGELSNEKGKTLSSI